MNEQDGLIHQLRSALPPRYRLLGEAGRGGMATVFRARDEPLGREVALKVLHREVAGALAAERFLREIRVAAGLQHPHIVPLYDSGEAEGFLYYVMPFVKGASLRSRLAAESTLTLDEVLDIARDVGGALSYAHERGVVHRDVKPENILLVKGSALVSDFGIARALSEAGGGNLTATGVVVGTPTYMSPEQASASEAPDGRSDLYSFACVVYEMLAGEPPFSGPTVWAVIARHHSEPPPSLGTRRPDLPQGLTRTVERALAKDPDERFPLVAAFVEALRESRSDVRGTAPTEVPEARIRNLPTPDTPILGRQREREEVAELLGREGVRLVTLTGPGGTGKTRLAMELAGTLAVRFTHGVWFVALASVSNPGLVASALASALGVRASEGERTEEAIIRFLRSREALLILDNFEQVVRSAPILAELLREAPGLRLLVTSRMVLNLRGEHEYPVPPLDLPDLTREPSFDTLSGTPSVQLFVARARARRPDFVLDPESAAVVGRICVRLDGLPLAIELAAARTGILTPSALLTRLERSLDLLEGGPRDLPDRQRTLRGTIDWSYGLLAPEERAVFRKLSVFVGGASLSAGEAVREGAEEVDESGPPEPPGNVLDLLSSLVDQSLVVRDVSPQGEPRLRMLETIREYAIEALEAGDEGFTVRRRHFLWYRDLAREAEPYLTGENQGRWLATLELEHDNLRAALEWAEGIPEQTTAGLEVATALWRFWLVRGHLAEGRSRLEQLLGRVGDEAPPALRARALSALAMLGQNLGDYESAREALTESLEIWRSLDDQGGIASGLTRLGWVRWRQCAYEEARHLSEEALELHHRLGDEEGVAHALTNLAWTALFQDDPEEALELLERTLGIRRSRGDSRGIAFALTLKGWSLVDLGRADRARPLLEEAVTLKREVGERQLLAFAQSVLANCLLAEGEVGEAETLLRDEALPAFRRLGDRWGAGYALYVAGRVREARDDPEGAHRFYRESLQVRQAIGDLHGQERARERLSALGEAPGDQAM